MLHSDLEIISILKKDIFGSISYCKLNDKEIICRNYHEARNKFFRFFAYILAKQELKALKITLNLDIRVPKLIYFGNGILCRSYIKGISLRNNPQNNEDYFYKAGKLLEKLHNVGIIHNDLEKPENWIVTEEGEPAIIDFQLSMYFKNKNNNLFLIGKKEDIRHLYKNKKRFCPNYVTKSELNIINNKHKITKFFNYFIKPIYNIITRKILNYSDRANSKYSR